MARGRPSSTRTPAVVYLTDDEAATLRKLARRLSGQGDYCQSDIVRAGIVRMLRGTRNGGLRWLRAQIDATKGGPTESESAEVLSSNLRAVV
jgi:hypothetical protein